jgi:hypothetical protein
MTIKDALKKLKPGTKVLVGGVKATIQEPTKPGNFLAEDGSILKYDPTDTLKQILKKTEKLKNNRYGNGEEKRITKRVTSFNSY